MPDAFLTVLLNFGTNRLLYLFDFCQRLETCLFRSRSSHRCLLASHVFFIFLAPVLSRHRIQPVDS